MVTPETTSRYFYWQHQNVSRESLLLITHLEDKTTNKNTSYHQISSFLSTFWGLIHYGSAMYALRMTPKMTQKGVFWGPIWGHLGVLMRFFRYSGIKGVKKWPRFRSRNDLKMDTELTSFWTSKWTIPEGPIWCSENTAIGDLLLLNWSVCGLKSLARYTNLDHIGPFRGTPFLAPFGSRSEAILDRSKAKI